MHLRDPFLTIFYLAKSTKIGGRIAFNFFANDNVPPIQREMRRLLFNIPISSLRNYLELTSYIDKPLLPEHYSSLREIEDIFQTLIKSYGEEEVKKHLHWETLCTSYIHCIPLELMINSLENLYLIPEELMTSAHGDENYLKEVWMTLRVSEKFHETASAQYVYILQNIAKSRRVTQGRTIELIDGRAICRETGELLAAENY